MPVVVKPPYDHPVFLNEVEFVLEKGIFSHIGDDVCGAPESRLVRDDEVVSRGRRAMEQVERGHEGRGNSCDRRVRIANLELVGGGRSPGHSNVLSDSRHNFASGQSLRGLPVHQRRR